MGLAPAAATAAEFTPPIRTQAPDTSDCANKTRPPAPVDESEIPGPGMPSPAPLPVPQRPAGGRALDTCGTVTVPGFVVPEEQTAAAWIVFDLDSGEVIAAKDPHGRYRPASIIKALIALVAIEELDPDAVYTATASDANMEGSRVGIGTGGTYTNRQLLQGLLMASGNDAAHALASQLGGDERALEKVNDLARSLGTQDTRVARYSGLDGPGMSTSAFDMALIYRHAWTNPTFAALVGTVSTDFPGYGDNPGFQLWNDNILLQTDPSTIGGKTGYTSDALHTYVGAMDRGGRRLAVVILNTTIDRGRAWQQGQRFLEAGYAVPAGTGVGTVTPNPPTTTAPSLAPTAAGTARPHPTATDNNGMSLPRAAAEVDNGRHPALSILVVVLIIVLVVFAVAEVMRRTTVKRNKRAARKARITAQNAGKHANLDDIEELLNLSRSGRKRPPRPQDRKKKAKQNAWRFKAPRAKLQQSKIQAAGRAARKAAKNDHTFTPYNPGPGRAAGTAGTQNTTPPARVPQPGNNHTATPRGNQPGTGSGTAGAHRAPTTPDTGRAGKRNTGRPKPTPPGPPASGPQPEEHNGTTGRHGRGTPASSLFAPNSAPRRRRRRADNDPDTGDQATGHGGD